MSHITITFDNWGPLQVQIESSGRDLEFLVSEHLTTEQQATQVMAQIVLAERIHGYTVAEPEWAKDYIQTTLEFARKRWTYQNTVDHTRYGDFSSYVIGIPVMED